jgi:hypothetical protein
MYQVFTNDVYIYTVLILNGRCSNAIVSSSLLGGTLIYRLAPAASCQLCLINYMVLFDLVDAPK